MDNFPSTFFNLWLEEKRRNLMPSQRVAIAFLSVHLTFCSVVHHGECVGTIVLSSFLRAWHESTEGRIHPDRIFCISSFQIRRSMFLSYLKICRQSDFSIRISAILEIQTCLKITFFISRKYKEKYECGKKYNF